jgi:hypothetical protein
MGQAHPTKIYLAGCSSAFKHEQSGANFLHNNTTNIKIKKIGTIS